MSTDVPTNCMNPRGCRAFSECIKEGSFSSGQRGTEVSSHDLSSSTDTGTVYGECCS